MIHFSKKESTKSNINILMLVLLFTTNVAVFGQSIAEKNSNSDYWYLNSHNYNEYIWNTDIFSDDEIERRNNTKSDFEEGISFSEVGKISMFCISEMFYNSFANMIY